MIARGKCRRCLTGYSAQNPRGLVSWLAMVFLLAAACMDPVTPDSLHRPHSSKAGLDVGEKLEQGVRSWRQMPDSVVWNEGAAMDSLFAVG